MALSDQQQRELQTHLQASVLACQERGLSFAAKWAAELLTSFPDSHANVYDDGSDTEVDEDDDAPPHQPSSQSDAREARREAKEFHRFLLAKSFFDCREYDRCAAVFLPEEMHASLPAQTAGTSQPTQPGASRLQSATSHGKKPQAAQRIKVMSSTTTSTARIPKNISQKALFLSLYAKYLSGEKRKMEDSETILGPNDGPANLNPDLTSTMVLLEEYFDARGGLQDTTNSQGWLDYLYGVVLMKSKSEHLAKQWLLRSVNINPYNWSAWLELANLMGSIEELHQIAEHLPRNVMTFLFHIYTSQELQQQDPSLYTTLDQIQAIFPHSAFLQQQRALMLYYARDHEQSMSLFEDLLKRHPHRLDGMDIFSNLLYILPHRPKLASLASHAARIDKFRPETNLILGNHYSLLSQHEKAILHFRRALQLDRAFAPAWTLMGHEYIELKNTQAAIEAYRRAVAADRRDYRAWYGLGQGYEMLECWSYALFYYQRAAALCPADPKMWAAVGTAYSRCGKTANAIQAFKRALVVGSHMDGGGAGSAATSFAASRNHDSLADPLAQAVGGALDPQILHEIALLYEREGEYDEAAAYMELTLAQEEGAEEGEEGLGVTQITSRARLWLARWCHRNREWDRCLALSAELCQDGVEIEEAKGLVRDVRGRLGLAAGSDEEEGGSDA